MARRYPRLGSTQKIKPGPQCWVCKQPGADRRVEVQVNWFRGDDDVYKVHVACIPDLKKRLHILM